VVRDDRAGQAAVLISVTDAHVSAARPSELGLKVLTHPGPPSVRILRKTISLMTGPDVFP
jgi:hypothetical protein